MLSGGDSPLSDAEREADSRAMAVIANIAQHTEAEVAAARARLDVSDERIRSEENPVGSERPRGHIEWWDEPEKNARWYLHIGCDEGSKFPWLVPLDDCPPPTREDEECARCCLVVPLVHQRAGEGEVLRDYDAEADKRPYSELTFGQQLARERASFKRQLDAVDRELQWEGTGEGRVGTIRLLSAQRAGEPPTPDGVVARAIAELARRVLDAERERTGVDEWDESDERCYLYNAAHAVIEGEPYPYPGDLDEARAALDAARQPDRKGDA